MSDTERGATTEIVKNLSQNDIEQLMRPLYQIGVPQSFDVSTLSRTVF